MTVRNYFKRTGWAHDTTFIRAVARKDDHSPFFHAEYQETPVRLAHEWQSVDILNSIVLNDKQSPITWLSGADWNTLIRSGNARCLLIVHPDDFKLLYPDEKQRSSMVRFIEKSMDI